MNGVLRQVVSTEYYRVRCRVGYGSVLLTLNCGHKVGKKQSQYKPGQQVRCIQCQDNPKGNPSPMRQAKINRNEQAEAFMHTLHETGWRHLNQWRDGGHAFELFSKNARTVIVQIYPGGNGFEVWRPVTTDNTILETRAAVEAYGEAK